MELIEVIIESVLAVTGIDPSREGNKPVKMLVLASVRELVKKNVYGIRDKDLAKALGIKVISIQVYKNDLKSYTRQHDFKKQLDKVMTIMDMSKTNVSFREMCLEIRTNKIEVLKNQIALHQLELNRVVSEYRKMVPLDAPFCITVPSRMNWD